MRPAPSATSLESPGVDNRGRLAIFAAAILWSSSGLFAKASLFDDWPVAERGTLLAFWRALFAGVLLAPAIRRPRWDVKLAPMALCFAAMNVTYLSAVTMNTAANAIWLQNTAPIWVFLFNVAWLRLPVNRRDVPPLVACAIGVGVILTHEFTSGMTGGAAQAVSRWGALNGLAAGVTYAAVVLFLRSLRNENPAWLIALNHLVTAAALAPYAIYLNRWPNPTQLLVLAGFGLLQMGLPYLLFFYGLRSVRAQEASLIALLEPVLVPVWVYLVLGNDETSRWTLVGGGFILAGLIWRYGFSRPAKVKLT